MPPILKQKAPWDAKYKRESFKLPVVKAVETLIESGDFNVGTIGDNLPNEDEIHEKYGSKNFLFTGSSRALNDATGKTAIAEFAAEPRRDRAQREVRHGSEQPDGRHARSHRPRLRQAERARRAAGPRPFLKEYFSTLEEGRADLMALWNVWDPKLKELGLISNQEEVAKAMYDSAALAALTQLRRIPRGDTIEEDHERDRQLIAHYIADKVPGSIEQFTRDGKTYVRVADYQKMRQGVGMLLAELMRIKAEGDYDCHQGAGRQIRRPLRSGAARPGARALSEAQPADILCRHERSLDRQLWQERRSRESRNPLLAGSCASIPGVRRNVRQGPRTKRRVRCGEALRIASSPR